MRYIFLLCLCSGLAAVAQPVKSAGSSHIISQQEMQQIVDMAGRPNVAVGNIRTFDGRYQGQRGTPYLLPYWAKGYVLLANGQRFDRGLLKFNTYLQELVMIQPPLRFDSIVIDRERVDRFAIEPADSGGAIVFRRFSNLRSNDPALLASYYRVIYSGRHLLLHRISKQFRPANYKEVYSPDIRYDAFSDESAYYVLGSDQRIVKVKLSTKSLLAALTSDVEAGVPASLDELRKQSVSTELDAVKLLSSYDQLLSAK